MLLRYDVNSYCKAVVLYKKDFENAVVLICCFCYTNCNGSSS